MCWLRALLSSVLLLTLSSSVQSRESDKDGEAAEERTVRLARYDRWQREAARRIGLDWLLAKAVRVKESFNDPSYISTTGAVGLMQLMPTSGGRMYVTTNYRSYLRAKRSPTRRHRGRKHGHWAKRYRQDLNRLLEKTPQDKLNKIDRRFDPRWNIHRGTLHLARDLKRFKRRYPRAPKAALLRMTVAAYYTGPGRVAFRAGRVILPRNKTRTYLEDVMHVYNRLKAGLPGR